MGLDISFISASGHPSWLEGSGGKLRYDENTAGLQLSRGFIDYEALITDALKAHIVSELVDYRIPVPWEVVARSIWTDDQDVYTLRQNWDRHLKRLRRKLAEAGFRPNLVRCDGRGNVELLTMPRDEVVDEG